MLFLALLLLLIYGKIDALEEQETIIEILPDPIPKIIAPKDILESTRIDVKPVKKDQIILKSIKDQPNLIMYHSKSIVVQPIVNNTANNNTTNN